MTYTLTLGQHRLAVTLNRKPGRPKKRYSIRFYNFILYLVRLATDNRRHGHPVSRVLRRLFENKKTKRILGINLTAIVLFTGIVAPATSAFRANPQTDNVNVDAQTVQLTTQSSVRLPVDSFRITQGYHLFHQAIDFGEAVGSPVYPIMDGVVETVSYNRFAYGNYIIINHGSGFKSLYAHLAKIVVEKNQEVDKNTVIGTIGTTGWTTGPHLHLEVYDNGRLINPLTILK